MSWIGLRKKGFEPLFPDEWNALVDALDILYAYWAHAEEVVRKAYDPAHLESDVAPAQDNKYDVGKPDRRWRDVYAYYGYFEGNLFVQGKPVIKDGDPIQIANFIDQARTDVDEIKSNLSTIAQNTGTTAQKAANIDSKLATIQTDVSSIKQTVSAIDTKVGDIQGKLGQVVTTLSEIEAETSLIELYTRELPTIRAVTESIDATTKAIDTKVADIQAKTGQILSTLSEIDTKVGTIETYARELPTIREKAESIDATTKSIDSKVGEVLTSLAEIDSKLASIRDYVKYGDEKLASIEAKTKEIDVKLAGVQVTLSEIDVKVGTIESYARELTAIREKTESIDAKLDTTNAKLASIDTTTKSIDYKVGDALVSLSDIDAKLASIKDYVKYADDKLASIETKTESIRVSVSNIEARVASIDQKFDAQLSTRASEATLRKCCAFDYDFAIRRNGGRLLAVIDFTVNESEFDITEFDLGLIRVEGNVVSKSIVAWATEGIPQPEGTGSPYVLKITVAPAGLVYVRIPIKAGYFKPFSAYITLYAKDYDVQVLPYVVLGGILAGARNKLPRYLRLPANKWGRFMVHWFMEAHHGCAEVVLEIQNPYDNNVDVYIGVVTVGEIEPYVKGHMLLFGWEDTFELELSNETLEFTIASILPTNAGEVASLTVEYGIAGDGSNPLNIDVELVWGGVKVISDSNSSTTPKYGFYDFKVVNAKRGPYGFEYMPFKVRLSTSGTGKLTKLCIVLKAFAREYTYQRYIETTVGGGSTVTLIDLSSNTKHIVGAKLEVTAPSDGDVEIRADTPEGEITLCKIPANTTKTVEISGRYTYLKAYNAGTSNATVRGSIAISDSYLPR